MRQRILIRGVCLALTLGFLAAGQCLLVAGESFAATGPGRTDEDDGALYEEYDEATAAALLDDVIEFGELASLVHEFNPTVKDARDAILDSIDEAEDTRAGLALERRDSEDRMDDAEDEGDAEGYAAYAAEEQTYRSAMGSYYNQIDRLSRSLTSTSMWQTEKAQLKTAYSLMIQYETQRLAKEQAEKAIELYTEQYALLQTQQAAGLATAAEVSAARDSLLSAQASLKTSEISLQSAYEDLCEIVGREPDEGVTVARIPEPDVSSLENIDRETDLKYARWNNSQIVTTKHTSAKTTGDTKRKKATIASGEQLVEVELNAAYQSMMEAKTGYEAAQASYEAALMQMNLADVKYQNGMSSRVDYVQDEVTFLQSQTAWENAKLALVKAIDTYYWAVEGYLTINI